MAERATLSKPPLTLRIDGRLNSNQPTQNRTSHQQHPKRHTKHTSHVWSSFCCSSTRSTTSSRSTSTYTTQCRGGVNSGHFWLSQKSSLFSSLQSLTLFPREKAWLFMLMGSWVEDKYTPFLVTPTSPELLSIPCVVFVYPVSSFCMEIFNPSRSW